MSSAVVSWKKPSIMPGRLSALQTALLVDSTIATYMQREGIEFLYSFDDDFDALDTSRGWTLRIIHSPEVNRFGATPRRYSACSVCRGVILDRLTPNSRNGTEDRRQT